MCKLQRITEFLKNLVRKTKNNYFQNLDIRYLSDNKKFWKTTKPYFSNKELYSNNIFLFKEKGHLVSNEKQLATIINNFFINITKDLELKEDNSRNAYTLEDMLKVFNTHQSVERNIKINEKFSFQQAT